MRLIEERCAMTFISDWVYDVRTVGENKMSHRLNSGITFVRSYLWIRSHRSLGVGSFNTAYQVAISSDITTS